MKGEQEEALMPQTNTIRTIKRNKVWLALESVLIATAFVVALITLINPALSGIAIFVLVTTGMDFFRNTYKNFRFHQSIYKSEKGHQNIIGLTFLRQKIYHHSIELFLSGLAVAGAITVLVGAPSVILVTLYIIGFAIAAVSAVCYFASLAKTYYLEIKSKDTCELAMQKISDEESESEKNSLLKEHKNEEMSIKPTAKQKTPATEISGTINTSQKEIDDDDEEGESEHPN
jgi:hypothetical protein